MNRPISFEDAIKLFPVRAEISIVSMPAVGVHNPFTAFRRGVALHYKLVELIKKKVEEGSQLLFSKRCGLNCGYGICFRIEDSWCFVETDPEMVSAELD